jgi:hypothetical protein
VKGRDLNGRLRAVTGLEEKGRRPRVLKTLMWKDPGRWWHSSVEMEGPKRAQRALMCEQTNQQVSSTAAAKFQCCWTGWGGDRWCGSKRKPREAQPAGGSEEDRECKWKLIACSVR